jgi:hypothetical protein
MPQWVPDWEKVEVPIQFRESWVVEDAIRPRFNALRMKMQRKSKHLTGCAGVGMWILRDCEHSRGPDLGSNPVAGAELVVPFWNIGAIASSW